MHSVERVHISFVGCGAFARRYHVPAIEADPAVKVVGICDPTPASETLAFAERHGAKVVSEIGKLPLVAEPPAHSTAIVSSPHTLHADHVAALLKRKYHVLVDKPFVMRLSEAQSLSRDADRQGLVNAVAFNRRFDRACLRTREILAEGGIGQVQFVQTVQLGYEQAGWFVNPALGGGGPYTGRGAHLADLLPWLLDARPRAVRSRLRVGTSGRTDRGGFIELDFDGIECQMTCIEEGWHMWDEVRLFGDEGLIEMRRPLHLPLGWSLEWSTQRGEKVERLAADGRPGAATEDYLAAVRGARSAACSFADAAMSVAIIEAAFDSAANGESWITL